MFDIARLFNDAYVLILLDSSHAGVTGEAENYKYKGWCEIFSWNWGMTSNRKSITAKDGVKTTMNELTVIKPIGVDST